MKQRRYTCIVLFLLLAYLGGSVGMFTSNFLTFHRNYFQEFVQQSDQDDLERLAFSPEKFNLIDWEEKGKEFEWQGKMFDVSRIERTQDGFVIFCIHDDEEDSILGFLQSLKEPGGSQSDTRSKIQPLFFQKLPQICTPPSSTSILSNFSVTLFHDPLSREIPSPPPRRIHTHS